MNRPRSSRIALAILTFLTAAWAIYAGLQTGEQRILVLQLSHTPAEVASLLEPPVDSKIDAPEARAKIRELRENIIAGYQWGLKLDNIFLFLYPLQFAALVWFATSAGDQAATKGWRMAAWAAAAIMIAAGAADWVENQRSGELLEFARTHVAPSAETAGQQGSAEPHPYEAGRWLVRDAALTKWWLLCVGAAIFGLASKRLLTRGHESRNMACLINLLLVLTGALYLTGASLEQFNWIAGRDFLAAGISVYVAVQVVMLYAYIYCACIRALDGWIRKKLPLPDHPHPNGSQ